MGNDVEDAIDRLDGSGQAPAADPVLEAIDRIGSTRETAMRRSIVESADVSPDTAAETRRLSLKFGAPPDVIARSLPEYRKREQLAKPYQAMQTETPKLASWIETPENHAVAKDDLENLGFLEWLVTAPQRAYAQTANQQGYADLRFEEVLGHKLTQAQHDQLEAHRYGMENGGHLGADNWFKKSITGAAQLLANQAPVMKYAAAGALEGGVVGAAAGSVLPGAGTAAGAMTGAGYGFHAGAIYGVLKSTFKQESALAFDEYSAFRDELGRPLDPATARAAALAVGLINAPIEAGAQELLLRSIPGLKGLTSIGVRDAVGTALKNPTIRAALFDAAKSYGTTLAGEVGQEVAQRAVTILAGEIAKSVANGDEAKPAAVAQPGKPAPPINFAHRTAEDVVGDLAQEAVGALQSFALGVIPGPFLAAVHGSYQANAAQRNKQIFQALGEGVAQSKLVERLPEAAQSFIEHATKDGPVEKVYAPVEVWAQYWQEKGIDPAKVAAEVTGSRDAYERAQQTGEDLEIPTARYATKLAASEHHKFFVDELRLKPGEMNAREADAYLEQLKAQAADPGALPAAGPTDEIRANLTQQLETAGVPANTAQSYATLYESVFANLGERAGVAPAELYARYGLQVTREIGQAEQASGVPQRAVEQSQQAVFEAVTAPLSTEDVQALDRRKVQGASPDGVERRTAANDAAIAEMIAEADGDTTIGAGGARQTLAELVKDPSLAERARSLPKRQFGTPTSTVDAGAADAQNKAHDTGAAAEGSSTRQGRSLAFRSVTESTPLGRSVDVQSGPNAGQRRLVHETAKQRESRRVDHFNEVFSSVLDAAKAIDPQVDEIALRKEFDDRLDFLEAGREAFVDSGHDPVDLLRQIAYHGGISLKSEARSSTGGGYTGELRWLRESKALGPFGSYGGVRGVFQSREAGGPARGKRTGVSLDDMLTMLRQDQRFAYLESIDQLLRALEDVSRSVQADRGDTFAGTDELQRRAGINPAVKWWEGETGFNQSAYHGSPHEFAKFSLQAIGTGEGAQSYGWGLYFASRREVAEGYRDRLGKGGVVKLDGRTLSVSSLNAAMPEDLALFHLARNATGKQTSEQLRRVYGDEFADDYEKAIKDYAGRVTSSDTGRLYAVEIPEDEDYLDWDKPIDEQSPKVQAALATLGLKLDKYTYPTPGEAIQDIDRTINDAQGGRFPIAGERLGLLREGYALAFDARLTGNEDAFRAWWVKNAGAVLMDRNDRAFRPARTGEDLYHALGLKLQEEAGWAQAKDDINNGVGNGRRASEALAAAGIPGIKYLDGFSRSSGKGTNNYVLFDDQLISITEFNQSANTSGADALAIIRAHGFDVETFNAETQTWAADVASVSDDSRGVGRKIRRAMPKQVKAALAVLNALPEADVEALINDDAQPALPGAEDVRATENATPAMETPFTLTSEASQRKGKQGALFQEKRGAIRFGKDRQMNIALFAKADLSTFLHESGHFFLEVLRDLASDPNATAQIKADMATLDDWFFGDASERTIGTDQHEKFARAFEAYLMKGEAPSIALRSSFARFRAWLTSIYKALKNLHVQLDDRIKGVMDRLVATDMAIADAQAQGAMTPIFTDARSAGMSDQQFALYRNTVEAASRQAQETLQTKLLAEVQREKTAAWKERRADIRSQVEAEIRQRPEFVALAAIQRGTFTNGESLTPGAEPVPMKLSKQAIVAEFGKGRLRVLPRPLLYTDEPGALTPSAAAELFGYGSGDELLTALAKAGKMEHAIDAETDRRMIAEQGSLLLDGSLVDQARGAAANEMRDAVVRAEMKALINLKRLVSPHVNAALRQADRERSYERRWFEAETKLKIAIAEGRKQVEIDELQNEVDNLKRKAAGGPALITSAIPREETITTAARNRIAGTRIRDIKPELFWSAARKAQRAAVAAAAKQDFDQAILAQQQQLLNLALFREAEHALEDAEKRARQAKDLGRPTARARLAKAGDSFLEQIDAILERYEFVPISGKQLDKRASLRRWVAAMEGENLPVELPDEVLDDTRRVNYSELTYDELVGVTDGLQQIVHLARLTLRRIQSAKEEDYAETRDGLVDGIEGHGVKREVKIELLPKDKPARVVGEWIASHTKLASFIAQLDGYVDGGPVWDAFMRPINEAATQQQTMHGQAADALSTLLKEHYSGRELARFHDQLFIPAIGAALSREARLAVALNWGNEGNRQRMMESVRHWNAGQVQAILDTLDERDLRFVQGSLDFINSYWPQIEAKQKRVFGIAPDKVAPASWHHAQFGEQRGGYYPIAYDGRLSVRQGNIIDADAAGLQKHANYAYATTKRGYTKAREEKVNAPVRLELSVMYEHVEGVIHDLTHHEMLIDVGRLLGDRKVQQAIASRVGDIGYRQMRGALLDIALGLRHSSTVQDRAINYIKNGTTLAGLGWNAWTAAQQWLGVFNGAARIGPTWVAKGLAHVFRDASSMEWSARWVGEKSEMMRHRGDTMNREIADLRATLKRSGSWFDNALRTITADKLEQEDITSSYLFLIEKTQQLADLPVWIGGYEKFMAAGETEARAIALADQAVLDSQSGGQIKDLAQVQRGGPFFKLFTAFYSYGNLIFNQTSRAIGQTNFKRVGSVGQMLGNLALIYVAPAAVTVALASAFGKEDPEDVEGFLALMGREMLATAMNTMVLVRELGGAVQAGYAKATGVNAAGGARGYEGPTGLRIFASVYRLAQQAQQGVADRGLLRATEDVAGVLFHLPLAQVQRSIDGFVALEEGRTHNPAALIFGPPPKKAVQ